MILRLILKKMGPSGLDKLTATIKKFEPIVMDLVKKILSIVIPVTFTLLAVIQILLKGEYKSDEKETKSDEKETKSDAKAEGQDDLINTGRREMLSKLDEVFAKFHIHGQTSHEILYPNDPTNSAHCRGDGKIFICTHC